MEARPVQLYMALIMSAVIALPLVFFYLPFEVELFKEAYKLFNNLYALLE